MKILVTGGAGFIGSNFVCRALHENHKIINIDKLTYAGDLNNLENYQHHPNHIFYHVDICNDIEIEKIIFSHKPDAIIHMAAESHVDRSIDCADSFIQTNINGTYTLLKIVHKYFSQLNNKSQFRFIHLSTDEVFGSLAENGKFDELMPYNPSSPYSSSKAASDLLVKSFFKTFSFPSIIVNASNNYGPKQFPEKLIPLIILNAIEGKKLPIYGSGNQIRDWLHVDDHIDALLLLLEKGNIGQSYCIGSNNEINNLELVYKICSILDYLRPKDISYQSLIEFVQDRPGHDFRYATNYSKLNQHTGWHPKIDFMKGLESTIGWYIKKVNQLNYKFNNGSRLGLMI